MSHRGRRRHRVFSPGPGGVGCALPVVELPVGRGRRRGRNVRGGGGRVVGHVQVGRGGRPHEGLHGRHLSRVVLRHGVAGGGRGEVAGAHVGVHEAGVERRPEEVVHKGLPPLRLGGQLSVSRLDPVLLHGDGPLHLIREEQNNRESGRKGRGRPTNGRTGDDEKIFLRLWTESRAKKELKVPPLILSERQVDYHSQNLKINDPTGKSRQQEKPHPTPQPDSGRPARQRQWWQNRLTLCSL